MTFISHVFTVTTYRHVQYTKPHRTHQHAISPEARKVWMYAGSNAATAQCIVWFSDIMVGEFIWWHSHQENSQRVGQLEPPRSSQFSRLSNHFGLSFLTFAHFGIQNIGTSPEKSLSSRGNHILVMTRIPPFTASFHVSLHLRHAGVHLHY